VGTISEHEREAAVDDLRVARGLLSVTHPICAMDFTDRVRNDHLFREAFVHFAFDGEFDEWCGIKADRR
jgi:hypothetical protein